ncbi:MAG: hypothetical protein NTU53_02420 [Planctomycetota bacterium]|nr:hypothetical protein [Planctomycetota bacterium]
MKTRRIVWMIVVSMAAAVSTRADFYVSPKGSDANPIRRITKSISDSILFLSM